jgi:eukaryotic-like serine/threonine-protein kinase
LWKLCERLSILEVMPGRGENWMPVKVSVREFVQDYCAGVADRDLIAKYRISAKDLIWLVKKLIQDGMITKDQYFYRNRKIDEEKVLKEKAFLQSLFHCPVCDHIQPLPFTRCPACEADISKIEVEEPMTEQPVEMPPALAAPEVPTESAQIVAPGEVAQVPKELQDLVGMKIESIALLPGVEDELAETDYQITGIISAGPLGGVFKAEALAGVSRAMAVRVYNSSLAPAHRIDEVVSRIIGYQAAMDEPNVLRVIGSGDLDGRTGIMYEHMPVNLESLVRSEAEGVPLDLIIHILPQILNAVGYTHLHRGTDGEIRRLPHLNLRLSKVFFDPETRIAKLEGCGVWRSLVDVRGHLRRLWEEPGVEASVLPPEAFVLDSKFVNPFLADIYALGVLLYRLTTAKAPFAEATVEDYGFAHLRKFPIPPRVHRYTIPEWLDTMILKCLEKEPSRRWRSATQMELAIGKLTAL